MLLDLQIRGVLGEDRRDKHRRLEKRRESAYQNVLVLLRRGGNLDIIRVVSPWRLDFQPVRNSNNY